jgi:DNA-directed RNA polymerase subunit RPC12/RpoP
MDDHEHEYAPFCVPCGREMDRTGSPPVCHSCGGCYEGDYQCIHCGEEMT